MSARIKLLPATTFILGIICIPWIVFDIIKISSDLQSVIFFNTSGLIIGIGYLFILLFHISISIIYLKYFRHHQNNGLSTGFLLFIGISFFAMAIQKVMFDEVGREYYLEYPAPGEVYFIYFGLGINFLFIAYALYLLIQEFKLYQFKNG